MEKQTKQNNTHDLKIIAGVLIRATLISLGILLVWSGWLVVASEYAYKIYFGLFHITHQDFISLNLIGLLVFKIFCTVFFLIPFVAIKLYERSI